MYKACISEVNTYDFDSDPDPLPELSIADASAREGQTLSFAVTLSSATSRTVTVSYRTSDGTAHASSDYAAGSGTLRFRAGDTRKTINVRTTDDNRDEPNETFTVRLHNASGATLLADFNDTATGTINDDDGTVNAAASSHCRSETTADRAIDGDDDTGWCATSMPAWLRLDLGESRSVSLLSFILGSWPLIGNVEVSTDGSSWTRVSTFTIERGSPRRNAITATVNRTIRYVRINFTRAVAFALVYEVRWQ